MSRIDGWEGAGLSAAAVSWLVDGSQGMSSKAMFHRLALGRPVDPFHYPADIDDFQRCERLLRAVPELRERLPMMAEVGPHWPALVEAWDEVARLLDEDAPGLLAIGWDALRIDERPTKLRRAEAVFAAASEKGWEAYRATGDTRSVRIGRITVTAAGEDRR